MKKLCYLSSFYPILSLQLRTTTGTPRPQAPSIKWHEAEMGAVFHYDLHVFDGIRYGQGNNRISPIEDYNIFQPHPIEYRPMGLSS